MIVSSRLGLTPAAGSSSRMIFGIGHQHAGELQKLALAAGKHARRLAGEPRQRKNSRCASPCLGLARSSAATRPGVSQLARRSRRSGPCAASMLLDRASLGKGRGIWKVRPRPRPMRRCGALARYVDAVEHDLADAAGRMLPAIRLNSVVLPAPFGPIRPRISPWPHFEGRHR